MKRDRQIETQRKREMGQKKEGEYKREKIFGKLILYINEKRGIYWTRTF